MNKKILLFSATLGIAYLGISSYSGGPAGSGAGNRTGSGGSSASCSGGGCHASISGTLLSSFVLKNKATSATVTDGKYTPDEVYIVTFACNTSTTGLPAFGFQAAATKDDNTNAGTITASAPNTIKRTVGSVGIIEHSSRISSTSTGVYSVNFEWKAPSKGAGNVTFYGIGNAVNGDGGTNGDLASAGTTTKLTEAVSSSIASVSTTEMNIFPNPCSTVLNIEGANIGGKEFSVFITDISGRNMISTTTQKSVDVSSLAQGSYIIRIDNGATQQTSIFVKK